MMSHKDVVVLLPGITGSVLSRNGKDVWAPSLGVVWRTITGGGSTEDLALDTNGGDNGVTATRLVPDTTIVPGLIKIDGYSRIARYLEEQLNLEPERNFFEFPYDWRLDNRVNAKRLKGKALAWLEAWRTTSGIADAKLVLIGHSMGGLVSRYFIECLDGWKSVRTLLTIGTPHRGSLNALGFLVHGMKKGVGPLGFDLSPLLRSYPSVYQLLPIYPCVRLDNVQEALRIEDAARAMRLPNVDSERVAAARAFHDEIEEAQKRNALNPEYANGYSITPIVGIDQPTYQSARMSAGDLTLLRFDRGKDHGGDGTVPRVSALPIEMEKENREIYASEMHGSLQNAAGPLANLKGILTREQIDFNRYRGDESGTQLVLDLSDDVLLPGELLIIRASPIDGAARIRVTLTNLRSSEQLDELLLQQDGRWQIGSFSPTPGTWRITVHAHGCRSVTDLVVVAET